MASSTCVPAQCERWLGGGLSPVVWCQWGRPCIGSGWLPHQFDSADQRRVWESLTLSEVADLGAGPVTILTVFWIARRYCGWEAGRKGRPMSQPREVALTPEALAVREAGAWAIRVGFDRVKALHADSIHLRLSRSSLVGRLLDEIRRRLDPRSGVAAIGSLAGIAGTLGCARDTVRAYLRDLAEKGLIIKNEGNSTSLTGTSGITIALSLPDGVRELLDPHTNPMTSNPPISDQTGKPIPQLNAEPVRNPSRSPYSHVDGDGPTGEGDPRSRGGPRTAPCGASDWTLGDWIERRVVLREIGDHLERLADKLGGGAVSRVLARLDELRRLRPSLEDVRSDLERAGDIAAANLRGKQPET